jgi:hypothetical protein
MTGLVGADVGELVSLGKSLDRAADRMESIHGEIGSSFDRSQWEGDDAQHFRDLWQHKLSGQLLQTASAARVAANVLARNAQQQVQASGSDNGPVPFLGSLGATSAGDPGGVEPWDPLDSKPVDWFTKGIGVVGGTGTILKGIGDLAKDGRILKAAEGFKGVAEKFDGVSAFVDGWELGTGIVDHDPDKIKVAAVDIAADATFKGLEIATVGFPPAFIAVGIADVGWQFVPKDDKVAIANAAVDVARDVGDVAGAVGRGYVDAATSVGHGVADAAGAAGAVVSGGLSGAKKFLHL